MNRPRLQNRVDPRGALHAVAEHGTLMGNRGILHDADNKIVRQWQHKSWVTCLLEFGDLKRNPFKPNNYSELFFLDEATSLAAGHRPCGFCQRNRFQLFKDEWFKSNTASDEMTSRAIGAIDKVLHVQRVVPGGAKRTYSCVLAELPIGTMFEIDGAVFLNWTTGQLPWSFKGYALPVKLPSSTTVQVLTPPSVVRMFLNGFIPRVHMSAGRKI
jgi:hypothetical protein